LVLVKDKFDTFLNHYHWDHAIKLTLGTESMLSKIYPLLSSEQMELDAFLAKNLSMSRIHSLKSLMAVLVFFIKKKDGSL